MNKFIIILIAATMSIFGCTEEYESGGGGGGGGYGEFIIYNRTSNIPITGTFATRCSDSGWGSNQGGVSVGGSLRLTGVQAGCWDVRLETSTQGFNFFNVYLSAGTTEPFYLNNAITPAGADMIKAENEYGEVAEVLNLE